MEKEYSKNILSQIKKPTIKNRKLDFNLIIYSK